ncbi:hypothetical protein XH92_19935 [Bradyrhizobium sp. CCBAU 53421]|nr:hypothetical protein XH92_19935 [Bradyrhizobium sp. CCBAU 53421]
MSRARQAFKQTDVTKAVRAVAAAGVTVGRVEISPDGRIIVVADAGSDQDRGVSDTSDDLRGLL